MKKLISIILVLVCLPFLSMAESNTASSLSAQAAAGLHHFYNIPFGLGMDEVKEAAETALGITLLESEAEDGIPKSLSAKDCTNVSYLDKPVSSVSFSFYETYIENIDGKDTTKYRVENGAHYRDTYIVFDTLKKQSTAYYIRYFSDLLDSAQDSYGAYSTGWMTCLDSNSNDTKYDLPINDTSLDEGVFYNAINENASASCTVIYGNVSLVFISLFGTAFITVGIENEIRNDDVQTVGYYGQQSTIKDIASFSYRNGVHFGMSVDEVKQLETSEPLLDSDTVVMYNDVSVAGDNVVLVYSFDSGKLATIFVTFSDKHANENKYIDDFESIDTALRQKYGLPSEDAEYVWKDDLYKDNKDDYGFAISAGDLIIKSAWVLDGVSITHGLVGDNYKISHVLFYEPSGYTSPVSTDGI